MKVVLYVKGTFFKLGEKGELKEIPEKEQIFQGDLCLFHFEDDKQTMEVHRSDIDDDIIKKTGSTAIGSTNIFTRIFNDKDENEEEVKYAVHVRKESLEILFTEYQFAKAIPLNWLLYKTKGEIKGFFTSELIYLLQMTNAKALVEPVTIFKKNINNIEKDFKSLLEEPATNKDISIYSKNQYENTEHLTLKSIIELINQEKLFLFEDTISLNYHSKKYKLGLYISSTISIILTPIILYLYISDEYKIGIYQNKINKSESNKSKLREIKNKISKKIIYKDYKIIEYNKLKKIESDFFKYKGVEEIKFKLTLKSLDASIKINGFENVKIFEKDWKKYIVENRKLNKEGLFKFKIEKRLKKW
jgi:hypothetical protein